MLASICIMYSIQTTYDKQIRVKKLFNKHEMQ